MARPLFSVIPIQYQFLYSCFEAFRRLRISLMDHIALILPSARSARAIGIGDTRVYLFPLTHLR